MKFNIILINLFFFAHCVAHNDYVSYGSWSIPSPETLEEVTDHVYFDIYVQSFYRNRYLGRIVIALFGKILPITVKNFVTLAKRTRPYGYGNGTLIHRVIKQFVIQSGDFTKGDGTGGQSIYGRNFEDENFKLNHWKSGMVSMANAGKDTNGSQFFITLAPVDYLNGKHVVFGEVVLGMNVVRYIEQMATDQNDRPFENVIIYSSGVI